MKRAVVLVLSIALIIMGLLTPSEKAQATNEGDHFIKGSIVAIEACYKSHDTHSDKCLVVVSSNNEHHTGKVLGAVELGSKVYKECTDGVCSKDWTKSVGESYLHGGERK